MKRALSLALVAAAILLSGCGKTDQEATPSTASGDTADTAKKEPSLADDGTLVLPEETRTAMGITTAPVARKSFSGTQSLPFQVFREADEKPLPGLIYRAGFAYALAVPGGAQTGWKVGQAASIHSPSAPAKTSTGRIVEIDALPASANQPREVVLEIRDDANEFELAQSYVASFSIGLVSDALVVPQSAILSSTGGTFVYVQNAAGYKRVPVKTGAAASDEVQVLDGLKAADVVVTRPVQTLWLTELKLQSGAAND